MLSNTDIILNNNVNIWLKNIKKFSTLIIKIIDEKSIIYSTDVHIEMLFVRRLFVDWIKANNNFFELRKYVSFKLSYLNYIKSLGDKQQLFESDKFFIVWKDFNIFMQSHGDYFLDIYESCMKIKKINNDMHKLLVYSIVSVVLFYKWRKRRNDSIRHWNNYNNRRKKKFNVDLSSFDSLILNEAKKYGRRYRQKITRYTL